MGEVISQPERACIRVYGSGQTGTCLRIVSDRAATIWVSQIIYLAGCHPVNPATGAIVEEVEAAIAVSRTLELLPDMPADLELAIPIVAEGQFRNFDAPPTHGALLLSSGEGWTGYEAGWMMRLQPCQ